MKTLFRVEEVAITLGVSTETITYFIKEEWIRPSGEDSQSLLDQEDIARLRLIWELRARHGVNDESIPLILHLVDQLHLAYGELSEKKW